MKTIVVIFLIFVISALVADARYYEQNVEGERQDFQQHLSDDVTYHQQGNNRHSRHRRKRQYGHWNNYVQDYTQPWRANYDTCPEREILSQMMKIMTLILQKENAVIPNVYISCSKDIEPNPPVNPSVVNRVPSFEDPNMNWGIYKDDNKNPIDHDQFTRRPLNLEPYKPQNDGAHDNNDFTTKSPLMSVPRIISDEHISEGYPNVCHFAYVACCDKTNPKTRHDCFANLGCRNVPDGKSCDPKTKQEAFNFMVKTYKLMDD